MKPTQAFLDAIAALIGADVGTLAEATPFVALHLAKAAFVPGPSLTLLDLVEADFAGYAAIHAASAATQVFVDPTTGLLTMQCREPAGGWHFQSTGAVSPSQTIYGWYLTDAAGTGLWGADLFDPTNLPIISGTGQAVDVDQVRFALSQSAVS